FSAVAGAPTVIAAPGLLANDTDPDGDPLTVKSVGSNGQGATAHGTVTSWTAGGGISYTPNPGWHGKDQFSYVLSDGAHDVIGQIEWNVTEPGNYPPVALDDEVSLRSGSEIQLPLGGVLANDTDLDGDALTVTGHGDPAYGTATIAPSGEVTYTPASGFVGQDQLSYMVSDGTATTTGALAIVVTPADAPLAPIVLGNRYRVEPRLIEAVTLAVPAPGLLGNDRSRSGAPLTVVAKTANDHGNILVQADGSFTYSPNQYFTGIASFDYTVSDGTSTATGHVAILVGDASAPADPVPGAFAIAPTPTITGIARVGELLTASAGSWSPAAGNLSYQWLRSGTAIAGATGASYRLTAADAGRPISVRTSGDAWGVATTVRISAASQVAPARFTAAPVPKIGGVAKQGRTLTAKAGSWKPGPVTLKYRWLRNGKTIAGATKAKYRLTAKDRGTRISVRVTATKPGYATAVKTSSSKRIAR
ncbi:MAG: tandem-95 repeat protein, partial [Actinobacteria bacterium]|nr:tandem-95 repeat protein [Actinomycetota bacterium]